MESLGYGIVIAVIIYTDYCCWIRGADSFFFKDKTELEKDLREIQQLEAKEKLKKLKDNYKK